MRERYAFGHEGEPAAARCHEGRNAGVRGPAGHVDGRDLVLRLFDHDAELIAHRGEALKDARARRHRISADELDAGRRRPEDDGLRRVADGDGLAARFRGGEARRSGSEEFRPRLGTAPILRDGLLALLLELLRQESEQAVQRIAEHPHRCARRHRVGHHLRPADLLRRLREGKRDATRRGRLFTVEQHDAAVAHVRPERFERLRRQGYQQVRCVAAGE
jgi:hypothetical protein